MGRALLRHLTVWMTHYRERNRCQRARSSTSLGCAVARPLCNRTSRAGGCARHAHTTNARGLPLSSGRLQRPKGAPHTLSRRGGTSTARTTLPVGSNRSGTMGPHNGSGPGMWMVLTWGRHWVDPVLASGRRAPPRGWLWLGSRLWHGWRMNWSTTWKRRQGRAAPKKRLQKKMVGVCNDLALS